MAKPKETETTKKSAEELLKEIEEKDPVTTKKVEKIVKEAEGKTKPKETPKSEVTLKEVMSSLPEGVTEKTDKAGIVTLNVGGYIPALLKDTNSQGVSVYTRGPDNKWIVGGHINTKEGLTEFKTVLQNYTDTSESRIESLVPVYNCAFEKCDFNTTSRWEMLGHLMTHCLPKKE